MNRHNNILLTFRNVDLEQNILFSIIESKHLVSQIKMPKKEKVLRILKLAFLLQVKVIFVFQHDFAKKYKLDHQRVLCKGFCTGLEKSEAKLHCSTLPRLV